jgi:hypothetical protein
VNAQYDARAAQHRPRDPDDLAREIRRLQREHGLSPRDLERALRLRPEVVAEALRNP